MTIESVEFKRTKNSEWESGIIINRDQLIVDKNGKSVESIVWDYRRTEKLLVTVSDDTPVGQRKVFRLHQ